MIIRTDPGAIKGTLKEAVAHAILGGVYRDTSGEGRTETFLFERRPSETFVTGTLTPTHVPLAWAPDGDETTNPIHIVTSGMDLKLNANSDEKITVKAKAALYVQVLPTNEDLKKYPATIKLSESSKKKINDAQKKAAEPFDAVPEQDRGSTHWTDRRTAQAQAERETIKALGITGWGEKKGEEGDQRETHAYPGMEATFPDGTVRPLKLPEKWLKLPLDDIPSIEFSSTISEQDIKDLQADANEKIQQYINKVLNDWLTDTDNSTGGALWAYPAAAKFTPAHIKEWGETLKVLRERWHKKKIPDDFLLPTLGLQWEIDLGWVYASNCGPHSICRDARVALINRKDDASPTREEDYLFEVEMTLLAPPTALVKTSLDRVKSSYRYNRYLSHYAQGFRCGVNEEENDDAVVLRLTWMPVYAQPRIRPTNYKNINVRFEDLASEAGVKQLSSLNQEFGKWINATEQGIDPTEGTHSDEESAREKIRFQSDLDAWKNENEQIKRGINILKRSIEIHSTEPKSAGAAPFRAWCMMQKTLHNGGKKKGFDSWRLFQLAFILANLGALVRDLPEFNDLAYVDLEWSEKVSLLYFATGGGKTEAFFGYLLLALFIDRLVGKMRGVTAMIRYPLRLLTTQQAQRLAVLLAEGERVRRAHMVEGSPFEIGFWVGSGSSDNHRVGANKIPRINKKPKPISKDAQAQIEDNTKLTVCPFCDNEIIVRRTPADQEGQIGHYCTSDECDWNTWHRGKTTKTPLPFYVVDEDIYERAPSVLLGTIDKLALIGQHPNTIRRFYSMFGLAHYRSKTTGLLKTPNSGRQAQEMRSDGTLEPLYPVFQNGDRSVFKNPFPSLIIQDEAHLLEESLGTFSGVFQTVFERSLRSLGQMDRLKEVVRKGPDGEVLLAKQIAASATVEEPEKQMEALYLRGVAQFPYPGPDLYRSFYAAPLMPEGSEAKERDGLTDDEEAAHRARFYASVITNGSAHTVTMVRVLGEFHAAITGLLVQLESGDTNRQAQAQQSLIDAVPHSALQGIYRKAVQDATTEELATLIDLHRIALTYVTNKKGGDQIMAAENGETFRIHRERGINEFDRLESRLISGSVAIKDIEEVIELAEDRPKAGTPLKGILEEGLLRSVVTTSAISHGVDVDEFNSMFFAGMPSNVPEYIQASSRVGRTHVGVSILVPMPQNRRDQFIAETHSLYHRFLERLIRPAAVNRWAQTALIRAIPSIFQNFVFGVLENRRILEESGDPVQFIDLSIPTQLYNYINCNDKRIVREALKHHLVDGIGIEGEFKPDGGEKLTNELIKELLDDTFEEIMRDRETFESMKTYWEDKDRADQNHKRSPMTSLRDVDSQGEIFPCPNTSKQETDPPTLMRKLKRLGG